MRPSRSIRVRSTASSPFTPTAPSPSTPEKSTSARDCGSRSRRWPPRSSACGPIASRSSTATPERAPIRAAPAAVPVSRAAARKFDKRRRPRGRRSRRSSLRGIPDVRVVRVQNFLAVVAKDEWAAVRAAGALKATWTESQTLPGSDGLDRWTRAAAVERDQAVVNRGDAPAALSGAARKFSATYFWPFQSHASLGPCCAVADVRGDAATIWSSSQGTHGLRANLSKVFGLSPEKVRVVFLDGSGSYGTNGGDHVAADAVLLSKTIGQPVRVQWSRPDETGWGPERPPPLLGVQARLDARGRIGAWGTQK